MITPNNMRIYLQIHIPDFSYFEIEFVQLMTSRKIHITHFKRLILLVSMDINQFHIDFTLIET